MKKFMITSLVTLSIAASSFYGTNFGAFDFNNSAVASAATTSNITNCKPTVFAIKNGTKISNDTLNELLKNYGITVPTTGTETTKAETPKNTTKKKAVKKTTAKKTTKNNTTQTPKVETPKTEAPKTETPKTETPANNYDSSFASQVLKLVNQERAKGGLQELTMSQTLLAPANKRAQEIVKQFSHTRPNGTPWSTVLDEYNISVRAAGENLAYGYNTPEAVVTGWMNSPGHRANIMNSNFNKIGVGVYKDSNGTVYCTQLFSN